MISLYYGLDTYSIESTVSKKAADAELIVPTNADIVNLSSNLLAQSFFNPKRVFVLKEIFTGLNAEGEKALLYALKNLPENTDVFFIEKSLPKKSKLLDWLKAEGEIKAFEESKGSSLVGFIKERVSQERGEIAPLAAERLATYVGPDKWQLTEEIKKLVLYKHDGEEIEPIETADVDLLVKANFEANIFALMDAFAAKNQRKAAELLNSFLDSGENEIYILTMIEKQFRNIAMAKFETGISESTLIKKAGLHPYVAKKTLEKARNFEKAEVVEIYQKLVEADLQLKSGYDPKQILLKLVI